MGDVDQGVAAGGGDGRGRVLVVITLEIGGGEHVELRVREGDDPRAVAADFASKYGASFMAATATDDTPDVREALIANLSAKVKHHMERAVRKRLKRRMSRAEARENAEVALREEDAAQAAKRRLPKSVSSRHSSARRASGLLPQGANPRTPSPSRVEKATFYNQLKSHYEREAGKLVRPQTTQLSSPALKSSATPKRTASRKPKVARGKKKKKGDRKKKKKKRCKGDNADAVFSRLYLQAFERERKISEMQKAAEQADMELALRTAGAKRDSDQNQAAPSAHNRLYSQGILSIMRNDNLHAKRVAKWRWMIYPNAHSSIDIRPRKVTQPQKWMGRWNAR